MIKQLQNTFSSLIHYSKIHHNLSNDYHWFITGDNDIIGIKKTEVTDRDMSILSTFLDPYNIKFPVPTENELTWEQRIQHTNSDLSTSESQSAYRFVYFYIPDKKMDPLSFKEAVNELFEKEATILWDNEQEGIIIEELEDHAMESMSYKQIIDVLISDLYVKMNFLVGPFQKDLSHVKRHYENMLQSGKIAFIYSDKNVLTFVDAIPYILVAQAEPQLKNEIIESVWKEFESDHELTKTIEMFFQCNLNISVTAKALYMHRNSLQYRIDKFNERTGVDIRDFHQALTVYLALLAKRE